MDYTLGLFWFNLGTRCEHVIHTFAVSHTGLHCDVVQVVLRIFADLSFPFPRSHAIGDPGVRRGTMRRPGAALRRQRQRSVVFASKGYSPRH